MKERENLFQKLHLKRRLYCVS